MILPVISVGSAVVNSWSLCYFDVLSVNPLPQFICPSTLLPLEESFGGTGPANGSVLFCIAAPTATSPLSLAGTRASASAHTLCVTATAAKAAAGAAPPGTSLSCFKSKSGPLSCNRSTLQLCQTRHYRTDSRGGYWLRQFGLADHTVTHLLMGANIAVFGLQMLWPEVTRALARVRNEGMSEPV